MGYFSNGTEGKIYEAKYCDRCAHQGTEDKVCPVWGAHFFCNYNQEEEGTKEILTMLIPQSKDGLRNLECTMFHSKSHHEVIVAGAYLPGFAP